MCSRERIAATAAGFAMGTGITWAVNEALVEMSVNAVFSVIFGLLLIALALTVTVRIHFSDESPASKGFVYCFAVLVLLSGIFSFVVDKEWFPTLNPAAKVPMYALLGIATTFALAFASVDLLNCGSRWYFKHPSGVIANPAQMCIVLFAAIALGLYFGVLFGSLDVEDHIGAERFRKDRTFTLPIGAAIGCLVGYLCDYFANAGAHSGSDAAAASKGAYAPVNTLGDEVDEALGSTI